MIESRAIVIRGSRIFEDSFGNICLDDLWRAAKAKETRSPAKWRIGRMAQALIAELEKKIKISSLKEDKPVPPSIYARRGRGSTGTYVSNRTELRPPFASNNDPSDGAMTGAAEPTQRSKPVLAGGEC